VLRQRDGSADDYREEVTLRTMHVPGLARRGSALVLAGDERTVRVCRLILEELELAVDVVPETATALRWLTRARYDLVICAPPTAAPATLAFRLRRVAPGIRIIMLTSADASLAQDLAGMAIEVLPVLVDVNALMDRLLRPAP